MTAIILPFRHPAPRPMRAAPKSLVYRNAGWSLVFAPADEAERSHRVRMALLESRTWGEFRKRMPPGEVDRIFASVGPSELPPDYARFDCGLVPGALDGDYPPNLHMRMEEFLPQSLLSRYGSYEATIHDGMIWCIEPSKRRSLVAALRRRGYEVTRREDLEF